MTTPTNVHYEGAIYHVGARGVRKSPLFVDDQDRRVFLALIDAIRARYPFALLALCLMSNHFHLLLQVAKIPLDRIMHAVMGGYARYFNRRYGFEGYVYDDRYFRKLVRTDRYLAKVIQYIHGNPVAAGIVPATTDWIWSSARQYKTGDSGLVDLDSVKELFGGELPFGLFEGEMEVPDEAYISQELAPAFSEPPGPPPDLESLAGEVVAGTGYSLADLRGPRRLASIAYLRKEFYRAAVLGGATGRAAAAFLGQSQSRVSEALAELQKVGRPGV